jgi:hypothetical protein
MISYTLKSRPALERDIPVIPILLEGAAVPKAEQLPRDLQELSLRHGMEIRHASFKSDMDRLIRNIKHSSVATNPSKPETQSDNESSPADGSLKSEMKILVTDIVSGLVLGLILVVPINNLILRMLFNASNDAKMNVLAAAELFALLALIIALHDSCSGAVYFILAMVAVHLSFSLLNLNVLAGYQFLYSTLIMSAVSAYGLFTFRRKRSQSRADVARQEHEHRARR